VPLFSVAPDPLEFTLIESAAFRFNTGLGVKLPPLAFDPFLPGLPSLPTNTVTLSLICAPFFAEALAEAVKFHLFFVAPLFLLGFVVS
jgi:hypothetical protein